MQGFAMRNGGLTTHQSGQPSDNSNNRKAIAANARVPVQRQTLDHNDQARLPSRGLGQGGGVQTSSSHPPQRPHQQLAVKRDLYDTDVASLDTTQTVSPAANGDYTESEAYEEEYSGEEDDEENQDPDEDFINEQEEQMISHLGAQHYSRAEKLRLVQSFRQPELLLDAHSYPTTTSGRLEDQEEEMQSGPDDNDDRSAFSPSPQRLPTNSGANQQSRLAVPVHPRSTAQPSSGPQISNKPNMLQRGAKIRNQERQQPLVSSSQPLTYSQTDRPHNSQPGPSHQFNVAHHGNYASPKEPPRGTGQLLHAYPARVRSSAQPRPTERFVQAPPSPTSADAEVHIEPVNKGAIEDYEHSELIQMSFERLKNERFDTDPRAETHVLSEDMLSKPLKDRLHHVQKSLDAGDQTKFFSSLPTDEWEDAGDWFLDQFQGLVNRAKIARQNKRKLAMDFEAEVEKRHYHVVKRQRTVDGALEKMHQKGLGLLPKSPTPVRQMNKKQSNGRE